MHSIKYIGKRQHSDAIVSFDFEPPAGFSYIAGQFVEMSFAHKDVDERGSTRWFSLSSAPHESLLSVTTRIDAQPLSSFKASLLELIPDDTTVSISDPMGDFVLPRTDQLPLIFLIAGIGIAPVRGMVATAKHLGRSPESYLWYAVANRNDVIFGDETASFFDDYSIVSGTRKSNNKQNSRLTLAAIKSSLTPNVYDKGLFYIAGPDHFVGDLKKQLEADGIDQSRLITDYFGNYKTI